MVQKLIVEVDSMEPFERYLRLAIKTVLSSQEELAVKVIDRKDKDLSLHLPPVISDQTKHFPVIFIGGWYRPKNGENNSYFNGYGPWTTFRGETSINDAVYHIKGLLYKQGRVLATEFIKKFGDGYNEGFNRSDGSVSLGFEIRDCGCSPEWLAISVVHIYHGK
ncbi:MAG: hypothetical protein PHF10_03135 [Patescibacteria group bacterium]|nr:hypothetical protein [Patescibacteria group bacterium]MDD5534718.1 hypothetical protein [Patescibacteria group bacterium]